MYFNNSVLILNPVGLSDLVWLWLSMFSLILCGLKSTILISTVGYLSFFFIYGFLVHCTGIVENPILSAASTHYYYICFCICHYLHRCIDTPIQTEILHLLSVVCWSQSYSLGSDYWIYISIILNLTTHFY